MSDFRVRREVLRAGDVESAVLECMDELKEMLWRESWKKEVELPVEPRVEERGGHFIISIEI